MAKLTIIRGLPGAGKSTYAEKLCKRGSPQPIHYEADMFFHRWPEGYSYDRNLIEAAHDWCYSNVVRSLWQRNDVVVSNTFVRLWELERYLAIPVILEGTEIGIVEMTSNYGSIHGIPDEKVEEMRSRWEQIPKEWNLKVKRVT